MEPDDSERKPANVIPFRQRPKKEPVSVLFGEDGEGFYADVNGFWIRAPKLEVVVMLVLRKIKETWA